MRAAGVGHSGAPQSGEPGIHTPGPRLWIPGSLAALGPRNDRRNRQSRNTRRERSSVYGGPFDHALELRVFLALGPTDRADLFQDVLRLEQIALLGVPHPVIGPGADVVRIGRERLLVPIFGVVIAPELAA